MAKRRRNRPVRAPSAARQRYRAKTWTATCSVCEEQMQLPVQTPAGVDLTCMQCMSEAAKS